MPREFVAPQHIVTTCVSAAVLFRLVREKVHAMQYALPQVLRELFGSARPHDEHLLAGADEQAVQALGVSQPVLARFQHDVAILCPDLVHEAQMGLGRR